jgi:outer membrane biosynthesis protein TonB
MSDHERGAYTPPTADAPLTFDPRQPVRGARPIPLTLILSVIVLAALVAAIFVFYQSGVRHGDEAPQTVGEPVDGIKSAAPREAQPVDPAAGLQIYRSDAGEPMQTAPEPKFAPPPEQPRPRPTTPVVVTQAPPLPPAAAAPPPALKPAIPAAPAPAPKAVAVLPPQPAPEPKAAPVAAEAKPAAPKPASGGFAVQIGAVSSTALANRAWSEAVAAAPGLAAGKGKGVERIERDGATLYRTAVTGFGSREAAQAFCGKLKAAGKSCFVR